MEFEFIVSSVLLVILTLICIYFGVIFVAGLYPIRPNIQNHKNNIINKQGNQNTDDNTRTKRVQCSPFCISSNNPDYDEDKNNKYYARYYPFGYVLVVHVISIIKRLTTKCKRYLKRNKKSNFSAY